MEETIFLPFGMMMLMFMVIFLAAQPMLESVLEEKSQRIAEVLLGSANAFQLMVGKLIGGVGGSLTVVATYAIGGGALAWYYDYLHLVPLRIVPWFIIYQVLAVMLFGSIFMAVGAAVNQLKEAQSMLMPIWLLMMFPLFVWIQVVRDPMGSFATWLSFIPPATSLMMVLRMGSTAAVPLWQSAAGHSGNACGDAGLHIRRRQDLPHRHPRPGKIAKDDRTLTLGNSRINSLLILKPDLPSGEFTRGYKYAVSHVQLATGCAIIGKITSCANSASVVDVVVEENAVAAVAIFPYRPHRTSQASNRRGFHSCRFRASTGEPLAYCIDINDLSA